MKEAAEIMGAEQQAPQPSPIQPQEVVTPEPQSVDNF